MKVRRIGAAFSAGLLVFAFAGCGKVADKVAEKSVEKGLEQSTGGSVDIDSDGGYTIKDKDGNEISSGKSKSLPDDWPKDVLTVPDGFTIMNVTKLKQDDGNYQSVMATGKGDPEKVIAPYKKSLDSNGFEIQSESQMGGSQSIRAVKGESDTASVTVMSDDDGSETTVSMSYMVSADEGS